MKEIKSLPKCKFISILFFCLQDSPFTNAGTGSNLNLVGDIECDASIMEGKSLDYGAVGALSGGLISIFFKYILFYIQSRFLSAVFFCFVYCARLV